jgi:TRAP-type C4-dicarboxylate transport system permease large subunit
MPVVILGGIYGGIFTPTEAAAVACIYAAVVSGFIHRELDWSKIWKALEGTALTTAVIFAIIAASSFLSVILAYTRIPQQITQWCLTMGVSPVTLLLAVAVATLILGTFLEAVPNMYVTIPLIFPVAVALKLDLMQLTWLAFIVWVVDTAGLCGCLYGSGSGAGIASECVKVVPYVRFGFNGLRTIYFISLQLVAEYFSSIEDQKV